jgi:hypothetical protein
MKGQRPVKTDTYIYRIMVPCQFNDGKPVRTRHHREWDKRVRKITGGLTINSPGRGQWVDPKTGDLYEERVIPVDIICTPDQMERIAGITLQHYDQLSVMYYQMSQRVIIRTPEQYK